jgi:hypothetical protein
MVLLAVVVVAKVVSVLTLVITHPELVVLLQCLLISQFHLQVSSQVAVAVVVVVQALRAAETQVLVELLTVLVEPQPKAEQVAVVVQDTEVQMVFLRVAQARLVLLSCVIQKVRWIKNGLFCRN